MNIVVPGAGETRDMLAQQERLAGLGQAVATVTHELRNPLAAMRTWLHVLEQKLPPDDAGLARPVDRIKRGIAQCDAIIDDLLEYSRGKELTLEPTRLDTWLRALVNGQFPPNDIAVDLEPGLADRRISIDRERLRRAVVNLIENAAQAVAGDGGSGAITIRTRPAGRNVEIRISDTGPGVPADLRPRIFEPLFSTKGSGIGLGLAIVAQIAEQHGGTVRLEDGKTGGACFVIQLPAEAPHAENPAPD